MQKAMGYPKVGLGPDINLVPSSKGKAHMHSRKSQLWSGRREVRKGIANVAAAMSGVRTWRWLEMTDLRAEEWGQESRDGAQILASMTGGSGDCGGGGRNRRLLPNRESVRSTVPGTEQWGLAFCPACSLGESLEFCFSEVSHFSGYGPQG